MTIAAIVLAAGASTRMGSPKPLLAWGEQTLLAFELDELRRSCVDDIVVVTGARADDVRRSLADSARHCVFNARWPQGRATSLACGATALLAPSLARPEAVVIQNVDQPTHAEIVDRLVDELRASGAEIVQPSYQGQAGHPAVLAGALLEELAQASEQRLGLRGVLEGHPPRRLEMDGEPIVRVDLDTPEALSAGRLLFGVPDPTELSR